MPNLESNEDKLIQALESCIQNGCDSKDIKRATYYLNNQTDITPKIRNKFYSLLSEGDILNIKKSIRLLEWLTYQCRDKLLEIINDDKLMEHLSAVLMEEYLQEPVLQLVKYWSDCYTDSIEKAPLVFQLMENLEAFGLNLPIYYQPQFDLDVGLAQSDQEDNEDDQKEQPQPQANNSPINSDMEDLFNPDDGSMNDAETIFKRYNELKNELFFYFQEYLGMPSHQERVTRTSKLLKKLNALTPQLCRFLDQAQVAKLNEMRETLESRMEHLSPKDGLQAAAGHPPNNSNYKIVVSESDNKSKAKNDTIWSTEDIRNYKTRKCIHGKFCTHAANLTGLEPYGTPYFSMLQCPRWHNTCDKRRDPLEKSETGYFIYDYELCEHSQNNTVCPSRENCRKSHNWVEKHFHPLFKGTLPCRFRDSCENKEYCPFYHNVDELQELKNSDFWKQMQEISRPLTNTANAPNLNTNNYQELDYMNQVSWKEEERSIGTYPPKNSHHSENYHHETHHHQKNYRPREISEFAKGGFNIEVEDVEEKEEVIPNNKYREEKKDFAHYNDEAERGMLHSKLIIRRKFKNPEALSNLFLKSQNFYGLPFISVKETNKQNEEAQVKEQNQNTNISQKSDKEESVIS